MDGLTADEIRASVDVLRGAQKFDDAFRVVFIALDENGKDEVRAGEIRLLDGPAGRRLEGTGGVVSLMYPRSAGGGKVPAQVEGRAKEMVFEEASSRAVYKGDVSIRQGDIATRSPHSPALEMHSTMPGMTA